MFCQHCGAQLQEGAKFCVECGAMTERQEAVARVPGTLRIFRKDTGTIFKTSIYIDGELKDSISNGKTVAFMLQPGVHNLELKTKNMADFSYQITIDEGIVTEFRFQLAMGMTKGSHKMLGISNVGSNMEHAPAPINRMDRKAPGRSCPKCGGEMNMQTVSESRKAGCGTILLYIVLCLTIFGILIVIPLALRRKTETVTYAVCQSCGYRQIVSRSK